MSLAKILNAFECVSRVLHKSEDKTNNFEREVEEEVEEEVEKEQR